jgi:cyclic lactone autoinducer peptide
MKLMVNNRFTKAVILLAASTLGSLLASIASASVSVASPWWNHRPAPPQELLKQNRY